MFLSRGSIIFPANPRFAEPWLHVAFFYCLPLWPLNLITSPPESLLVFKSLLLLPSLAPSVLNSRNAFFPDQSVAEESLARTTPGSRGGVIWLTLSEGVPTHPAVHSLVSLISSLSRLCQDS